MTRLNVFRIENENLTQPSIQRYINNLETGIKEITLRDPARSRLYLVENNPRVPDWVGYLKGLSDDTSLAVQPMKTAGALLVIQPDTARDMVYVFAWGNGHHRVNKNRIVHSLGIRCVLNMMSASTSPVPEWDPARIKSIKTKRLGVNPLIIESQFARDSSLDEFPVDTDSDQLKSITGRPLDSTTWGKLISGSVSLHINAPDDPADLIRICNEINDVFTKTAYRDYFEWVDHITAISEETVIQELDRLILDEVQKGTTDNIILTVPDLVNWEAVEHFEYEWNTKTKHSAGEPDLAEFRAFLKASHALNTLTIDLLKTKTFVKAIDDSQNEAQSWSGYDCLSGEVEYQGKTYMLDNGAYFSIEKNFLTSLNNFIDQIVPFTGSMPKRTTENENQFIDLFAEDKYKVLILHKNLIHRTGSTPIEVCDILYPTGHLLHLKYGAHSSLLSHLFSQAAVSGELLIIDDEFKSKLKDVIKTAAVKKNNADITQYQFMYTNFQPSVCTIVLGIITTKPYGNLSKILPFFSKINLRAFCKSYQRMGYKYEIAQIAN